MLVTIQRFGFGPKMLMLKKKSMGYRPNETSFHIITIWKMRSRFKICVNVAIFIFKKDCNFQKEKSENISTLKTSFNCQKNYKNKQLTCSLHNLSLIMKLLILLDGFKILVLIFTPFLEAVLFNFGIICEQQDFGLLIYQGLSCLPITSLRPYESGNFVPQLPVSTNSENSNFSKHDHMLMYPQFHKAGNGFDFSNSHRFKVLSLL